MSGTDLRSPRKGSKRAHDLSSASSNQKSSCVGVQLGSPPPVLGKKPRAAAGFECPDLANESFNLGDKSWAELVEEEENEKAQAENANENKSTLPLSPVKPQVTNSFHKADNVSTPASAVVAKETSGTQKKASVQLDFSIMLNKQGASSPGGAKDAKPTAYAASPKQSQRSVASRSSYRNPVPVYDESTYPGLTSPRKLPTPTKKLRRLKGSVNFVPARFSDDESDNESYERHRKTPRKTPYKQSQPSPRKSDANSGRTRRGGHNKPTYAATPNKKSGNADSSPRPSGQNSKGVVAMNTRSKDGSRCSSSVSVSAVSSNHSNDDNNEIPPWERPRKANYQEPKGGWERDLKVVQKRQKDIDKGKDSDIYRKYISEIPKKMRIKDAHPKTPNKWLKMPRRSWDMQQRVWRKMLHFYDKPHAQLLQEEPLDECAMSDVSYDGDTSMSDVSSHCDDDLETSTSVSEALEELNDLANDQDEDTMTGVCDNVAASLDFRSLQEMK